MNKPVLIIFTEGHPDVDTGFIAPELTVTHIYFERIFVYPLRWENKPTNFRFPENVIFSSELAEYLKSVSSIDKKISGIFSSLFWSSVFKIKLSKYKSLLNTCGYTELLAKWITKLKFDKANTIFYTYWLVTPALALSSLKRGKKILYTVSRAHGFDLYNERGDYVLNFFKPFIFHDLNKLFCISGNGMQYLLKNYSNYSDKFTVSHLGTFNHVKTVQVISDSVEIISCSFLSAVKRIELLILGIAMFQNKFPSTKINWIHIGGGPMYETLQSLSSSSLKPGTFCFTGTLSVTEIYNFYASHKFACLINVSESEGLPVSIIEAQSFGIPVIATAVGGTTEIVNEENGLLLEDKPSPDDIATAIYDVVINREKWERKRNISRKNWEEKFDADKNYRAFSHELLSIMNANNGQTDKY